MKKKTFTSLLSVIIACCLSISLASATTAPTETIQRLAYITQITASLEITSVGRADCAAKTKLRNTVSNADLTIELQRSTDSNSWTTIKSWSTSGSGTIGLEESYYVLHGYYYQVVATVNVYTSTGNLAETASATSIIIYY